MELKSTPRTTEAQCCCDRYVIRTRNLQDWNLTRCRCANRSVEESRERDAARALFGVVDLAQAHGALAQARVRREDGVLTLTGAADGLTHLGLLDLRVFAVMRALGL